MVPVPVGGRLAARGGLSRRTGIVLIHPDRGELSLPDVVLANAHDGFHHQWDIDRSLRFAEP